MSQLSIRPGDRLTVEGFGGDVVLQCGQIGGGCVRLTVSAPEEVSLTPGGAPEPDPRLRAEELAGELLDCLSSLEADEGQELLSKLVPDLFYAQAQRRQSEERRRKQAEGIARAKARGTRFGVARKPLPDSFPACYEAWRAGDMTATQAAAACGISRTAFYRGADKMRQTTA